MAFAAISFAAWAFHPGYQRGGMQPPSPELCAELAEALWQQLQLRLLERERGS